MLLKCGFLTAYRLNCFYRAMRADCFFERLHFLITLTSFLYYLFLQTPAEQQNCTSSTWDIFKSQSVRWVVSFNFCIFLLLIIKTKALHKHHERILISWKHIQKIPKLRQERIIILSWLRAKANFKICRLGNVENNEIWLLNFVVT